MQAASDDLLKSRLTALISSGKFTKTDLGLGHVDDTGDLNKPISTATQAALNSKISSSLIGAINGVAPLDSTAKISVGSLPNLTLANSLTDVQITTPAQNQVLTYSGTKWQNTSGGGAADLSQPTIPVGPGDASTAPGSVTLRGPNGVGTDVAAGDLKIQAPLGTGTIGSGDIILTAAMPSVSIPNIIFLTLKSASSSTTNSFTIPIPATNISSPNMLVLLVWASTTSTTISSWSVGGTNVTSFGTAFSSAALGTMYIGYINNPPTGSSSVSVTLSAAVNNTVLCIFAENTTTLAGLTATSNLTTNTSISTQVPSAGLTYGDLVIDMCQFAHTTTSTVDAPNSQAFLDVHRDTITTTTNRPSFSMTCRYVDNSASAFTMSRTYASASSCAHNLFIIKRYKQGTSAAPSVTSRMIVNGMGMINFPSRVNFDPLTLNMDTFTLYVMNATSPIYYDISATLAINSDKYIILPPAHELVVGTTYIFQLQSTLPSFSSYHLFILPRISPYFTIDANLLTSGSGSTRKTRSSTAGVTPIARRSSIAMNDNNYSRITLRLLDANYYGGVWLIENVLIGRNNTYEGTTSYLNKSLYMA